MKHLILIKFRTADRPPPPRDSVFIPMCNKRYISKPQNKEIGSVSGKTDSPMSLLSCSRFSGWLPIWSMDAIPRNPSYSVSFSPLIFLLHYPFLIFLYLWLNMYFSKDANSVPTFESPWIHRGWTPAHIYAQLKLMKTCILEDYWALSFCGILFAANCWMSWFPYCKC